MVSKKNDDEFDSNYDDQHNEMDNVKDFDDLEREEKQSIPSFVDESRNESSEGVEEESISKPAVGGGMKSDPLSRGMMMAGMAGIGGVSEPLKGFGQPEKAVEKKISPRRMGAVDEAISFSDDDGDEEFDKPPSSKQRSSADLKFEKVVKKDTPSPKNIQRPHAPIQEQVRK